MKSLKFTITAALAFSTLGLVGCGTDPSDGAGSDAAPVVSNKITGTVEEWKVNVSAQSAEAGEVIFAIANYGSIQHEFLVTKTSYEPGKIPIGSDNRFDEEDKGLSVADEIPEWAVNESKVLKVNLEAGTYELLCNIAGHYANGMHTSFTVLPGEESGTESAVPETDVVSNDITGTVEEWEVGVSAHEALAGDVKFTIENQGTIPHEFIIVKTDFALGKIPLGPDNRFDEDGEGLSVPGEISEWNPKTTGTVTLKLDPGNYQLLCNIAGHYANGMYTTLTVTEPAAEAVSNDITGTVEEWEVGVSAHEALAGDVKFTIENQGTIPHEFIIVKTDFALGKIPLGPDNRFDEDGEGLSVPGEISEWNPKTTGTVTLKLDPGNYQLLCNIAGHYANGMYTQLTVS